MRSQKTLKRWYRKINKRFFDSMLPNEVCVRYVNEEDKEEEEKCEERYNGWAEKLSGEARHKYLIVICPNNRVNDIATLVHEMIHVSLSLKDSHGAAFEAKRQMISDRGIFKKNAIYKGITLF